MFNSCHGGYMKCYCLYKWSECPPCSCYIKQGSVDEIYIKYVIAASTEDRVCVRHIYIPRVSVPQKHTVWLRGKEACKEPLSLMHSHRRTKKRDKYRLKYIHPTKEEFALPAETGSWVFLPGVHAEIRMYTYISNISTPLFPETASRTCYLRYFCQHLSETNMSSRCEG